MDRDLRTVGEIAPERAARVSHASQLETLEEVLRYGLARQWEVDAVVVQDEYTHDVIVRTPGVYLVFDTT